MLYTLKNKIRSFTVPKWLVGGISGTVIFYVLMGGFWLYAEHYTPSAIESTTEPTCDGLITIPIYTFLFLIAFNMIVLLLGGVEGGRLLNSEIIFYLIAAIPYTLIGALLAIRKMWATVLILIIITMQIILSLFGVIGLLVACAGD
ncbi:MAG: hypothetical protein HZC38_19465 [Chloroflexi bacterium]|nr:hypothetical protein [Chloroflexota bacterium]